MKITKSMIERYAVFHCDTKEKANELLNKLDELGYTWANGDSYFGNNKYGLYGENSCYSPFLGTLSNIGTYIIKNFKIIDYELDDDTDYKFLLEKANYRISELGRAVKRLKGSNVNKENRIKNLESKLEEYKSIDGEIDYDQLIKSNKRLIEINKKDNNEYLECICEQLKCALTGKIYYTSEFLEILDSADTEKDRQLMKKLYFKEWRKRNGETKE